MIERAIHSTLPVQCEKRIEYLRWVRESIFHLKPRFWMNRGIYL